MGSSQPETLIATSFKQTNLISDGSVPARSIDPNLINPWGMSYGSAGTGGEFWISDAGKGLTSIDVIASWGVLVDLFPPVTIPSGTPGARSIPTGQLYNQFLETGAFTLPNGSAAVFLFATEDGTVAGWNIPAGSQATTVVNESTNLALGALGVGAVYKGVAIGQGSQGARLYVANFRHGTVDVFDGSFGYTTSFTDLNLPDGYAPFNVRVVDDKLFVTFALQDAAKQHDAAGVGNGFVDEFDLDGHFTQQIAADGPLNSPWGIAIAPASFGRYAGNLLVGNFGDGTIDAYDIKHGNVWVGSLADQNGSPIVLPDIWEVVPGNTSGGLGGDPDKIYFTAGMGGEAHGLIGSLTPSSIYTDNGQSTLLSGANGSDDVFICSGGNDTIITGSGSSVVAPGAGDHVMMLGGNDTVLAGSGSSSIFAFGPALAATGPGTLYFINGNGPSTVLGGQDGMLVSNTGAGGGMYKGGSAGKNLIVGGTGRATIFGAGDRDLIFCGSGGGMLVAGPGNEVLSGVLATSGVGFLAGSGNALLGGGNGANQYIFVSGHAGGSDLIAGFNPDKGDTVALSGYDAAEWQRARASEVNDGSNITITLSDHTRVTFAGVDRLNDSSFVVL